MIDKYNIPRRGAGNKTRSLISEETEKEIIELYKQGEPVKDIAKKFSISTNAVNYYINKYDVPKRRKQYLDKNELKGGNNMANKQRLTEEQIQELIKMYKNNDIDIEEICTKFSIAKTTLHQCLRRHNIPTRRKKNGTFLTEEQIQELIKMYKNNDIDIKDICDKFSISKSTVTRLTNKYNIPKRNNVLTEEIEREIVELYKQGKPIKDIFDKFSIDKKTLYRLINKYNIPKRNNVLSEEIEEEIEREIIEMYKQDDVFIGDICNKFSINRSTVSRLIKKYNIPRRGYYHRINKITNIEVKEIIEMYKQDDIPVKNICDKFSITKGTLYYYINMHNIPKRGHETYNVPKHMMCNNELKGENNMAKTNVAENAEVAKFIEMLKNGASENDIAMEFGISKDIVSHLADKYVVKCEEEVESLTDLEEKIVKLYNSKAKLIVICKRLKVSNGFIYSTLKKAKSLGYTVKSRIVRESKIDTKLAQRVKALRECGASLSETSKILGIPIGSINGYVNLCDDNTEDIIDTIADIPLTKKQQQIVDLYVKGASIDSISDKYNISATGINRCIDTARKNGQDIPVTINTLDTRCILFKELPKEVKDKIYFIYYCLDFTIPNTVKWFKSVDPCFNHSTLNKLMHEWGVDKKCKSYNSVQREAFELRKQIYTDFISSGLSVQEYCAKGDTLIIEPALEIIIDQFSNNEKQVTPIVDTPIEVIQESPIMENQQQIEEVEEIVVEDTTDNNSDEVIEVVDTSSKNNEIKKITNTCTHVYCTFFQDRHYFPDFVKSTIYEKRGLDSYTMFNMDYLYKKSKEFIESNVTFDADGNANADIICYMSGLQTVTGALMKACLDLKVNLTFMHYNKESDEWYNQPVIDVYSSGDSLMNKLVDMLGGSSDYSEYKYNDLYTHGDVNLSDSFYIVKVIYFDENGNPYHVQGYLDMQGWDLHNQFAREMYENPSIKSKVDLYQVFHDETKASEFKIVGSICSSYNFAPISRKK